MSNIIPASVLLTLDGKNYVLRFRALAFIRYAAECDGDLLNDIRRIGTELATLTAAGENRGIGRPLGVLTNILWAGLVDAQPMLKRDDVGRLFGFREMEMIMTSITDALTLTMPELAAESVRPIGIQNHLPSPSGLGSGSTTESESDLQPANSNG
jgi:hypothetical protein